MSRDRCKKANDVQNSKNENSNSLCSQRNEYSFHSLWTEVINIWLLYLIVFEIILIFYTQMSLLFVTRMFNSFCAFCFFFTIFHMVTVSFHLHAYSTMSVLWAQLNSSMIIFLDNIIQLLHKFAISRGVFFSSFYSKNDFNLCILIGNRISCRFLRPFCSSFFSIPMLLLLSTWLSDFFNFFFSRDERIKTWKQ